MPRKSQGKFFTFLLVLFLLFGVAVYQTYQDLQLPLVSGGESQEITVIIPPNASVKEIGLILQQNGIIRNAAVFRFFIRTQANGSLKAGEYALGPHMTLAEIQERLVQGYTVLYSFTIPEGYNIQQITNLLVEKGLVDREHFLNALAKKQFDYDFLRGLPANPNRLEGFLFPATYSVPRQTSEEEIIALMVARFAQELTPAVRSRLQELKLSVREAVILASLVEREAVKAEERPTIAAVFHNRLKRNMKLEACSTIQYILGTPKEKLLFKDLEVESPYNTYKYAGLPPGPIASPGKASFDAVMYPAKVNYLYFVAKGDNSHYFSNTLDEHNRAVAKYIR
ncbi:MAG: endolytic transglycosylase MltG [Heliobacteriaceae bacterium]|nr:endolytic transglycosylase MltG [Heliobacteriaceae bacterium]